MTAADKTMYLQILQEELVPALGCTEPIAVALAAAAARKALGVFPQWITAACSGNIIKNVTGVTVPNCGGLKGIAAAAIIGAVGGDAMAGLEVLQNVCGADIDTTKRLLDEKFCKVKPLESAHLLHIQLTAGAGDCTAFVEICDRHTNIVRVLRNGVALYTANAHAADDGCTNREGMCVAGILDFATEVELCAVRETLARQIAYNTAIAAEGLSGRYGAGVGAALLALSEKPDARVHARAMAAAGSDARMSGCGMPVVTNSGSGNQGMTASLPVIAYAREYQKSEEALYRALLVSNLVAIHQKTRIGRLSAYCGAVSAASGAAAGIAFLMGGDEALICQTITNTLGNVAGMICDGAKPSCAAKIASAVDAALLGWELAKNGKGFLPGEGIVKADIEGTIAAVGRLGHCGMRRTDLEIISIMTE